MNKAMGQTADQAAQLDYLARQLHLATQRVSGSQDPQEMEAIAIEQVVARACAAFSDIDQRNHRILSLASFLAKGQYSFFWQWKPAESSLSLVKDPRALFDAASAKRLNGWRAIVAPEDLALIDDVCARSGVQAPEQTVLLRVRSNNGTWRQVEWRSLAVDWASDGQPLEFFGVLRDAERDRGDGPDESLLARLNAAEGARREKNLFLANISHDIRTPINAILGLASLTETTALSREQAEYVRLIRTSAESVVGILSDVLDFSRIEAGGLELDPVGFSPRRMCSDTLRALAFEAQKKGIEVILDVAPSVPSYVRGDATRIKQIVTNLFQNAVKFTAAGEISVSLQAQPVAHGKTQLSIVVRDTGCGIPEAVIKKIFDAYSQADASIVREYGGSGLGLSICRRLAEMMGGTLRVESTPGEGSAFTAELVCELAEEKVVSNPASARLLGRRFLVVCSNASQARSITSMLEEQGAEVGLAHNLADGLELLARAFESDRKVDWALLDFGVLPSADAEQLARLKALRLQGTIAITGVQQSIDDLPPMSRSCVDGTILKPMVSLDLLEALAVVQEDGSFLSPPDLDVSKLLEPPQQKVRVLIAEDNPVSRRVTTMLLEKAGYLVEAVCDGKEAVERLEHTRFATDVVIMDLQMPRLDGIAATQAIRMHEMRRSWVMDFGWKQLPVIGLTGDVSADTLRRCLAAGMTRVLTKPVRPDGLLEAIADVLNRKSDLHDEKQMGEMANLIRSQINPAEAFAADKRVAQSQIVIKPDEAVDLEPARAWFGWDVNAFEQMAADFFAGLAEISPQLRKSLEMGDYASLSKAIERLKGALGRICAESALHAADGLDAAMREGDVAKAEQAFAVLMEELNSVSSELRIASGK